MWRAKGKLSRLVLAAALGVGLSSLAMVTPADAGGVHVTIGVGIPTPVYVAPPPFVVAPTPVIVHPAPRIIYPPSVVIMPPYVVHKPHRHWDHGRKHHGYHPVHGYKHYKHKKHAW